MNRRHRALIAVFIAIPLFAGPLVSPVPDHDPHIEVSVDSMNFSTEDEKEKKLKNSTTMHYQNSSASAQRLFDTANKGGREDDVTTRFEEAPTSWTTLFSKEPGGETNRIYVHKDGQYYYMNLHRHTPKPSLQAFMLRLGPLLGAIGLGTLAGYFVLTAED